MTNSIPTLSDQVKARLAEIRAENAARHDSASVPASNMDVAVYLRILNNGPRA